MFSEGKFRKYVIYAVGEIGLIMIGILFALQINNWNDARKSSHVELEILEGIVKDLETNLFTLNRMISFDSAIVSNNRQLIRILEDKNAEYTVAMDTLFGGINRYHIFFPQGMAYENLKAKGLELVKNKSLRLKIVQLYDWTYLASLHLMTLKQEQYFNSNGIFLKNLKTVGEVDVKRPNNFELLKEDDEFINYLTHITEEQVNTINIFKRYLNSTMDLRNDIRAEIGRLEG